MAKLTKEQKIVLSKQRLTAYMPFLGFASYQLPFYIDDKLEGIACTDGFNIMFNAKFLEQNEVPTIAMVMAHEIGHIIYKTVFRRGTRDNYIWNVATDFIINAHLDASNANIGSKFNWNIKVDGKLCSPCLDKKYDNMTAEAVYDLLVKDAEQMPKSSIVIDPQTGEKQIGDDGDKGNGDGDGNGDVEGDGKGKGEGSSKDVELEAKANTVITRAYQEALDKGVSRGVGAGCFMEMVEVSLSTQVNWKKYLLKRFKTKGFEQQDISRPSRRCLVNRTLNISKYYYPRLVTQRPANIAVCIDDSGSLDSESLEMFLGEINNCLKTQKDIQVYLYSCDTSVHEIGVFKDKLPTKLGLEGRGGTAFTPALEHMHSLMKKDRELKTLFYFTDGYGDNDQVAKMRLKFKVVWCVTTDEIVPNGVNIKIDPYV